MGIWTKFWLAIAFMVGFGLIAGSADNTGLFSSTTAAWAQAIGAVGAVAGGWLAVVRQAQMQGALEIAKARTQRRLLAVRAVGLAHVAYNRLGTAAEVGRNDASLGTLQDLEVALEADRLAVSAFPIWELDRGDAMIAFTSFPGLLAYAHRAVRRTAELMEAGSSPALGELESVLRHAVRTADVRGKDLRKSLAQYLDGLIANETS